MRVDAKRNEGGEEMTLGQALETTDELKANHYSEEVKIRWVNDLESLLYYELIYWHEDAPAEAPEPYTAQDMERELMVPDPYSDVYLKYLYAQIDFHNAEFSRYNNSAMLYNTALTTYADWYNRNHAPKQPAVIRA